MPAAGGGRVVAGGGGAVDWAVEDGGDTVGGRVLLRGGWVACKEIILE